MNGLLGKAVFSRQRLVKDKVLAAAAGFFAVTLLAKGAGYIEKLILSYYWGTGYQVDVYQTVLTLITAVFLFTRELTEPGLLNFFVREKGSDGLEKGSGSVRAKKVFTAFFKGIFAAGALVALFAILFPQPVISLFAPGFAGGKKELAIQFTRISFMGAVFYCLSSLTGTMLIAYKKFTLSAAGDLVLKLFLVTAIVISAGSRGPVVLAWGIVAGCAGRLVFHLAALGNPFVSRHAGAAAKEAYRGIWRTTWPLFFGISFSQLTVVVYNSLGSYLGNGAIAALDYAKRTAELPVILFPYILSIVLFPFFSEFSANGDKEAASQLLTRTCKMIVVVFLPLSFFAMIYSHEIISLVYARGAFDERSVSLTSLPFRIYSAGLVFMALETVLVVFFYSFGDTRTPVVAGIICAAISMATALLLIPKAGIAAIPFSFVAGRALKNISLLFLLKKRKFIRLP